MKKKAAMVLAKEIAQMIVDQKIGPYEGARRIWWECWNKSGFPEELNGFVNDATDYESSYPPDTKLLSNIPENAKKLLDTKNT